MLKDVVLKFLSDGDYISGEMIAERSGVTRNAVWRAVGQLRAQGYDIQSVTNRGYRLVSRPDILDRGEIIERLGDRAGEFDIIIYEDIDSTNRAAFELARQGAPAGTVVTADRQSAGRGRLGRSFFSPPGCGIYMSLLLRPRLSPSELPRLTSFAAVAVARAVDSLYGTRTGIKWVNDLYLDGKKFCGILSQASMDMELGLPDAVVIGIGVNVLRSRFPEDISAIAGSLEELTGKRVPRSALIPEILLRLYAGSGIGEDYLEEYRGRSVLLGKEITVHAPHGEYAAVAEDIDENASLVVRLPDGSERIVNSGDVSVRLK